MQSMEIYRTGKFRLTDPKENDAKCGVRGDIEYRYEVAISGDRVQLEPPLYFIIDSGTMDQYFQERYVDIPGIETVSCEVMALRALEHFRHIFNHVEGYKNRGINKIVVKIWGTEHVCITASWSK